MKSLFAKRCHIGTNCTQPFFFRCFKDSHLRLTHDFVALVSSPRWFNNSSRGMTTETCGWGIGLLPRCFLLHGSDPKSLRSLHAIAIPPNRSTQKGLHFWFRPPKRVTSVVLHWRRKNAERLELERVFFGQYNGFVWGLLLIFSRYVFGWHRALLQRLQKLNKNISKSVKKYSFFMLFQSSLVFFSSF